MSEQEYLFRGAAFGGFNRGDVLSYIQKTTEEHRRQTAELRQQLEEAAGEREALQASASRGKEALEKLPELEGRIAALTEENSRLKSENDRLRAEGEQLQEKIRNWAPSVTTYDAIKDQMAEIELDARQRGAILLQRAGEQAGDLRRQASETVQHTADWYDRTRNDTNQTLAYLCQEMERIRGELQALSTVMDCDGQTLFGLSVEEQRHE